MALLPSFWKYFQTNDTIFQEGNQTPAKRFELGDGISYYFDLFLGKYLEISRDFIGRISLHQHSLIRFVTNENAAIQVKIISACITVPYMVR